MSTVSENIKYLRKLKGYTQEQFAQRIGIKRSLLGAYEEARANPNEIYLDSMAEVLGVDVEHLLHENLKEKGRRLGAGMIMKLNPDQPDKPTSSLQEETGEVKSEESKATAASQMGLFDDSARKGSEVFRSESVNTVSNPVRETNTPHYVNPDDSELVSLLTRLLASNPDFRIFSQLDDLPTKEVSVIGKRIESAKAIVTDQTYVIVTHDNRILFRRAFNQIPIKGTVILSSDFGEKPTLELRVGEISEVYLYQANLQTAIPSVVAPVQRLKSLAEEMLQALGGR